MGGQTTTTTVADAEGARRQTPEGADPAASLPGDDEPQGNRERAEKRLGSTISEFELVELLGRGGAASVYRAVHEDGRTAAIKVLHLEHTVDLRARKRLLREAYLANSIDHPGVVRVLGDGVAKDGAAYLILELCEGETLQARKDAAAGSRLAVEDVARWMDELLDVLAVAHDRGIVHRDIKPANLLVTRGGSLKVLDFGIARATSVPEGPSLVTRTGAVLGTPHFMPPEQVLGSNEVDARSDIWAVGATMFTLLTGRYVHAAGTVNEAMVAAATQQAQRVRSVRPDLPASVAAVVDRALAFNRQARFGSAREMQEALRKAMRGETTEIRATDSKATLPEEESPPSEPRRVTRRRRGRWWFALLSITLIWSGVQGCLNQMEEARLKAPPEEPRAITAQQFMSGTARAERITRIAPVKVAIGDDPAAIAVDSMQALALTSKGQILVWDAPQTDQLWDGRRPFELDSITKPSEAMAANHFLAMGVDQSGGVWARSRSDLRPTALRNLSGIRSVALGLRYALLLRSNGTLAVMSFPEGVSEKAPWVAERSAEWLARAPVFDLDIDRVVSITARGNRAIALRANGTVWIWGDHLRTAEPMSFNSGYQVPGISQAVAIATGFFHSLALDAHGAVFTWGDNTFLQLGHLGASRSSDAPEKVPVLPEIKAIAAGMNTSLALDSEGRVWEWGISVTGWPPVSPEYDVEAQRRAQQVSYVPHLVDGLPPARLIASAGGYSLAVCGNELWVWGFTDGGSREPGTAP